ncbi:dihydroorotase [Vibrio nitrifigilis]|uniref:Amidohydrolase family protein n=1 Tax=Vibrio nitrifigilis TaxID=2789781 RepID=A0ABS0GIB3_9VIBR|nr:amidohydrolase family protein [Vibrio nitrifigilis]MBF9002176.1 amidohydrolase family protein [Vibrio nitrifigilis]
MSSTTVDLLLKGDVVLSDHVSKDTYVGVKDGLIVGIYADGNAPEYKEFIDASGKIIFPGMVDAHVHSYSNMHEQFTHSTAAAAAGGVTTIIEMPYDSCGPVFDVAQFKEKQTWIADKAKVDVALLSTIKKQGDLSEVDALVELGTCGFKLSAFETDPYRFPRIDDDVLWTILPKLAETGLPVGFHCENDVIIEALIAQYKEEGKTYPKAHCETRPPISETLAVSKLLEFAYWTKFSLHVYHNSHPRCLDMIDWYKEQGVDVSVETCPHYLLISDEDMSEKKAFAKINPPMRDPQAVEGMWQALIDGRLNWVASDHAPWPLERKSNEVIFDNGSGAPGVESILPLMFSEGVVKRGIDLVKLGQLLAANPAERFKLDHRKGKIAVGMDADFAIIDPNEEWFFNAAETQSSAKWSPYDGKKITGRVVKTVLRGTTIFDQGKVLSKEGDGAYVGAHR